MADTHVMDGRVRAVANPLARSDTLIVSLLILTSALLIAPLWITALPPMSDFPAHAAILFIQTHSTPGSVLSKYYGVAWSSVPNLASELIVPPLAKILPLIAALKLFVSVGIAMWIAGPALVQYALMRRLQVTALIAPLFAYNKTLLTGLTNFYFASGFGFLVIAFWIQSERMRPLVRAMVMTVLFTILYFLHGLAAIFVFAFLAIYEVAPTGGVRSQRGLRWLCLAAIPALISYAGFSSSHAPRGPVVFDLFGGFAERVASISWVWFGPFAFVVLTGTGVALALRLARLERRMVWPLIAVVAACLVLPSFAGGAWGSHIRYPAMGVALMFAALSTDIPERALSFVVASIVVVAGVNAALLSVYWHTGDEQSQAIRAALEGAPTGAKTILAADDDSSRHGGAELAHLRHVAEYAIIDRSAFVPIAFARPAQHIVFVQPAYRLRAARTSDESGVASASQLNALARRSHASAGVVASFPYLVGWPCFYDNLVLLRVTHQPAPKFPGLRVLHEQAFFTLYAIAKPSWCSAKD
jgi:hypothetical protein